MTRFIIIVDVFRVFVDTGEIKYIPFSEEALQCLYVGRVYVDLQVVGTDNDFTSVSCFRQIHFISCNRLICFSLSTWGLPGISRLYNSSFSLW